MGPAPNVNRRRRNATVAMVPLPATGRSGPAPAFPLGADIVTQAKLRVARARAKQLQEMADAGLPVDERTLERALEKAETLRAVVRIQRDLELKLWRDLWKTPQAVAWERLGWTREVAQYVRWKVLGESGDLNAAKEARQLSDRLGLSPLALLRLRWEIVDQRPTAVSAAGAPSPAGAEATAGSATVTDMTARTSRRSRLS
jgi:hypothetical protein